MHMDYQKIFEEMKKTAIVTDYAVAKKEVPIGKSKFGGKPHLPQDFEWFYYEGEDFDDVTKSRPLSFLMQINLEEIAAYDEDNRLPHKGMLYFFYDLCTMRWGFDPKDKGSARVLYIENPGNLQSIDFPEDLDENFILPELALSFSARMDLPDYEEIAECVTETEWDDYNEERVLYGYEPVENEEISKLLGYANLIQGEMLLECEEVNNGIYCGGIPEVAEEEKERMLLASKQWELLFQMSTVSVEGYELMFGDCGNIYFYIRKQDLQDRNFDNVWLILQCF